jgi:branched-chain amino acid transport system substrate-binding protein
MRARPLAVVALLALVLAVAGCSGSDGPGDANSQTVRIGFIGPLTGPQADFGLGARNAVELAIRQANQHAAVDGWRIELAAEDDKADPETGRNAAQELAADPAVVGVIGTINSGVAKVTAPVLAGRSIVQISPCNTDPTLTLGPYPIDAPRRVFGNYFRLVVSSLGQGRFGADYAFDELGFRSAATVNDQKGYGQGLVSVFERQFRNRQGRITSSNAIEVGERDFGDLAAQIVEQKPDFVYYGGEYPEAAPLAAQLRKRGFEGPLVGGDGLYSDQFISSAGGKVDGAMATSIGAPVAKLDSARQFVADYGAAGFGTQSFSAFGAQAYDSANILIAAMATVLPGAKDVGSARAAVVDAVEKTSGFRGITGEHTFDQFGDTLNTTLTMYRVESGAWRDVFIGTVDQQAAK